MKFMRWMLMFWSATVHKGDPNFENLHECLSWKIVFSREGYNPIFDQCKTPLGVIIPRYFFWEFLTMTNYDYLRTFWDFSSNQNIPNILLGSLMTSLWLCVTCLWLFTQSKHKQILPGTNRIPPGPSPIEKEKKEPQNGLSCTTFTTYSASKQTC